MRNLLVPGAAAAALALTATLTLSLSDPGHARPAPRAATTLHLTQRDRDFEFVDQPPKGGDEQPPSVGDQYVIGATIVGGGTNNIVCTATHGGAKALGTCTGVLILPHGQITFTAGGELANDITAAVTGGTGRYAGASGVLTSKSSNSGGKTAITVRLR